MSVEFDTPANRIISEFAPKNKFGIDTSLPNIPFLRQLAVQGRLRYITTGSIIPTIGETFFCYSIYASNASVDTPAILTVANDGVTRFSLLISPQTGANNSITITNFMDSLVGDGIKAFTTSGVSTTILGWVENTARIRDVTN